MLALMDKPAKNWSMLTSDTNKAIRIRFSYLKMPGDSGGGSFQHHMTGFSKQGGWDATALHRRITRTPINLVVVSVFHKFARK